MNSPPVVKWGRNAERVAFDHAAAVVSAPAGDESDFTLIASRPLPADTVEHYSGSLIASGVPVRLKDARDSASCWIESRRRMAVLDPK